MIIDSAIANITQLMTNIDTQPNTEPRETPEKNKIRKMEIHSVKSKFSHSYSKPNNFIS